DVLAAGDPQQLPAARRGHAGGMLVAEVVGMGLAETGERAEHRGRVLVHEGQGADCRLRAGGPGAFTSWHAQQCTQVAGPAGAARPGEARVGSGTAGAGLQCTAWTSNPAVPPPREDRSARVAATAAAAAGAGTSSPRTCPAIARAGSASTISSPMRG